MKNTALIALTAALTLGFGMTSSASACEACGCTVKMEKEGDKKMAKGDIVDTAMSAGMFNTLVAAVKQAELVETLKSEGPFTVMAPTDEAFAKLPAGTVETLLKPENKSKLVEILTYHVIPMDVKAADALEAGEAETVQGGTLTFSVEGEQAMVNGVKIIKTDISATNGTIHVIDEVLMPEM